MAEGAPGPRGRDGAGSRAGLRCPRTSLPRDAPGRGSDGGAKTPTSSVTPSEEEEEEEEEEEQEQEEEEEEQEQEQEGHQWRVGDACRTAWTGDGRIYPARLRALDPDAGTCLVEFDGYGNTEERALADLLPPHPAAWGASDTPWGEDPPSSSVPPPGARRRRKGERPPCSPRPPEVMSPSPLRSGREEEEEEAEALAAMLMAWYMSGYHTGFYVGLREGRMEAAERPPRPGRRQKKPPHS